MYEASTIKDISKALGLSTSTVSRALRGSHEISNETKRIVLEYAEKIHYKPNPIALSLKGRRNYSIGVIVSEIANNFFSQIINGIESIAYSKGYNIIISQSHESHDREIVNVNHLAARSVDGLIVSMASESKDASHLKVLHQKGMPMVFFDRITDEINTFKVKADNEQSAYEATRHLLENGFRQIAHITNSPNLSITRERLEGYKKALIEYNIEFNPMLVQYVDHGGKDVNELSAAIENLNKNRKKFDAIVTASDRISTSFLSLWKKLPKNKRRPIGVVGFTNSNIPDIFDPPLTTIRQPAFEMGQIATELLIKLIESKRPVTEFETRMLPSELIIRQSSLKLN